VLMFFGASTVAYASKVAFSVAKVFSIEVKKSSIRLLLVVRNLPDYDHRVFANFGYSPIMMFNCILELEGK